MEQLKNFIRIVENIGELMHKLSSGFMSALEFRNIINQTYQEFISAAIPLMNDPTIRLTINNGLLEIVTASGNRVGISRHQAALLSQAIQQILGNTSGISQPCNRSSCRICPRLRVVQSERGWSGNCDTTGVIYSFSCTDCHRIVYAGQTTQLLRNRMNQHLNNPNSALRCHTNSPNHRNPQNLLDIFNIIIMWSTSGVDTELEDSSIKRIMRNWEIFFQWLSEAHKSQGGGSKR